METQLWHHTNFDWLCVVRRTFWLAGRKYERVSRKSPWVPGLSFLSFYRDSTFLSIFAATSNAVFCITSNLTFMPILLSLSLLRLPCASLTDVTVVIELVNFPLKTSKEILPPVHWLANYSTVIVPCYTQDQASRPAHRVLLIFWWNLQVVTNICITSKKGLFSVQLWLWASCKMTVHITLSW